MNDIADGQTAKKKTGQPPPTTEEAAKDLVKKKRTRPDTAEAMSTHLAPGDNTKYINHSLAMWDWVQPDLHDPIAVRKRVQEYFQLCADSDMKPNVPGLAFAFGVDRKTLWAWVAGTKRDLSQAVKNELKRAYQILNVQMEDYMQNGKINPVSGIFLMKNNMGYEDKTEMVVTPNTAIGDDLPEDELRKRIAGDVVTDRAIEAEYSE